MPLFKIVDISNFVLSSFVFLQQLKKLNEKYGRLSDKYLGEKHKREVGEIELGTRNNTLKVLESKNVELINKNVELNQEVGRLKTAGSQLDQVFNVAKRFKEENAGLKEIIEKESAENASLKEALEKALQEKEGALAENANLKEDLEKALQEKGGALAENANLKEDLEKTLQEKEGNALVRLPSVQMTAAGEAVLQQLSILFPVVYKIMKEGLFPDGERREMGPSDFIEFSRSPQFQGAMRGVCGEALKMDAPLEGAGERTLKYVKEQKRQLLEEKRRLQKDLENALSTGRLAKMEIEMYQDLSKACSCSKFGEARRRVQKRFASGLEKIEESAMKRGRNNIA